MKASISLGLEIGIDLCVDELSMLEHETLKGTAKVRELPAELNPMREIELFLGRLQNNLFVEMESLPKGACFEAITKYLIIISQEGYQMLKDRGQTCDRIGFGPCRVDLYVRK
ncbi:hypothetical protein HYV79_00145 [Candidatus Woesearchaeota archaeon]|nr:hypothetical protein [Candidatus Woesearchaeota archaeon]